jgi:uncharacterized Zn finger protein
VLLVGRALGDGDRRADDLLVVDARLDAVVQVAARPATRSTASATEAVETVWNWAMTWSG